MEKIIAYVGNDVHQEFIKTAVYLGDKSTASIEKVVRNDKYEGIRGQVSTQ